MAIGPDNQILLGCNAASPDGHRNSVVIDANSGSGLGGPPGPRRRRRSLVQSGRRPLHHPVLQHAVPHSSSDLSSLVPRYSGSSTQTDSGWTKRLLIAEQNSDTTVTAGNPRTIHSVAAGPSNKQIFLPIPAIGGTAPQFDPSLCDSLDARNNNNR